MQISQNQILTLREDYFKKRNKMIINNICRERIFTTCTTSDGDVRPWCATAVSATLNLQHQDSWSYCNGDCPGGLKSNFDHIG